MEKLWKSDSQKDFFNYGFCLVGYDAMSLGEFSGRFGHTPNNTASHLTSPEHLEATLWEPEMFHIYFVCIVWRPVMAVASDRHGKPISLSEL
jgi:hypothetical protein